MKKSTRVLIAAALAPVLSIGVLTACSSNDPAPTAAPESASSAPAASDEELITEDLEKYIGTTLTSQQVAEALREEATMHNLETLGFDVDSYAANLVDIVSLKVNSVDVTGETAIAHVTMNLPDFNDAADALMEQELEKLQASVDIESMTEEEMMPLFMDVMNRVLTDPDFPTTTQDFDIEYAKNGDKWEMSDTSALYSTLQDFANSLN